MRTLLWTCFAAAATVSWPTSALSDWALDPGANLGKIQATLDALRTDPDSADQQSLHLAVLIHREAERYLAPGEAVVEPLVKEAASKEDGIYRVPGVLLALGGWAEARADFRTAETLYAKGLRLANARLTAGPGGKEGGKDFAAKYLEGARCALGARLGVLLVALGRPGEASKVAVAATKADSECETVLGNIQSLEAGFEFRMLSQRLDAPVVATAKATRRGAQAALAIRLTNVSRAPLRLKTAKAEGGGMLPDPFGCSAKYFPNLAVSLTRASGRSTVTTLKPGTSMQGVWILPASPLRRGPHRLDLRLSVESLEPKQDFSVPLIVAVPGVDR